MNKRFIRWGLGKNRRPQRDRKVTLYARDASGNVMSVYEKVANFKLIQKETHLYGSSRLGMVTSLTQAPQNINIDPMFGIAKLSTFTRAEKIFELKILRNSERQKLFIIGATNAD